MSRVNLFLLGPPRLVQDGQRLEVDARKALALLAYLAVRGEDHRRETLDTLLWPNLEPRRARTVLRRKLSTLNKALSGQWSVGFHVLSQSTLSHKIGRGSRLVGLIAAAFCGTRFSRGDGSGLNSNAQLF